MSQQNAAAIKAKVFENTACLIVNCLVVPRAIRYEESCVIRRFSLSEAGRIMQDYINSIRAKLLNDAISESVQVFNKVNIAAHHQATAIITKAVERASFNPYITKGFSAACERADGVIDRANDLIAEIEKEEEVKEAVEKIRNGNLHESVARLMDNDLREQLHDLLAPCLESEFLITYAKAHEKKFGEPWICVDPLKEW